MKTTLVTRTAGLVIACLLAAVPVVAQDVTIPKVTTEGSPSIEQIESAIQSIGEREGISAEIRSGVVEHLRDARTQVQNTLASETMAAAHADFLLTAPAEIESLRARLDVKASASPTLDSLGITDATTLEELKLMLAQESAGKIAIASQLMDLDEQIETQGNRPGDVRQRIAELHASRETLASAIDTSPPPAE